MSVRIFLPIVVLLLTTLPLSAQQIKQPADLLPGNVLLYAEIKQPRKLADEIEPLVRPSVLGNVPDSLVPLRKKYTVAPDFAQRAEQMQSFSALALSSEALQSARKVKAAAVAVMGVRSEVEIEYLAILFPGTSTYATLLTRLLQSAPGATAVEKVEGVYLYRRHVHYSLPNDKPGGPKFREVTKTKGPAIARMHGVILVGSPDAVKQAILRAKGKVKTPSLAKNKDFQRACAKAKGVEDVFVYAPAGAFSKLRKATHSIAGGLLGELLGVSKSKTLQSLTLQLGFDKGTLHVCQRLLFQRGKKSPLAELLPRKNFNRDLLRFVPDHSMLVIGLANEPDVKHWKKVVERIDEAFPSRDPQSKFSSFVKSMEQNAGINLGKDVFSKIKNVGVSLGDPMQQLERIYEKFKKGGAQKHKISPLRIEWLYMIQATDQKAAEHLMKLLPKLYNLQPRRAGKVAVKKVKGHTIHVLPGDSPVALHYARTGDTILITLYQDFLVEALMRGQKRAKPGNTSRLAARFKKLPDGASILAIKPLALDKRFNLLIAAAMWQERAMHKKAPRRGKQAPKEMYDFSPDTMRLFHFAQKVLSKEQWLVLGVHHDKNEIRIEGNMPGWQRLVPTYIDLWVEDMLRHEKEILQPR